MTSKMNRVKQEIIMAVIQYGMDMKHEMPKLVPMLDVGVMSIDEFADEIIMELIRHSFDLYQEKKSIRGHLVENEMLDDSHRVAYGRALKYAQKYRDLEADRRIADGNQLSDEDISILRGTEMKNIEQKKVGHQITPMQFFELTQLREVDILKSFVEHRLENTHKVSHGLFKEMFSDYDLFLKNLCPSDDMTSEEYVFNTLAFWVLEWKYPLQFFYDVAVYMENNSINNIEAVQLCRLCGDCMMTYKYGKVSTHSRFIKKRSDMILTVLYEAGNENDEVAFDTFTLEQYLTIKALILQRFMIDVEKGVLLKDWFVQNTNVDDWASFLKEYDLFSIIHDKEWNDSRINAVRDMIKKMTVKY